MSQSATNPQTAIARTATRLTVIAASRGSGNRHLSRPNDSKCSCYCQEGFISLDWGMTTAFRLLELLLERGLSQSEVARQTGLSFQAVNHLCSGRAKAVSLDTLDRLARVLGLEHPGELLDYKPKRGKA